MVYVDLIENKQNLQEQNKSSFLLSLGYNLSVNSLFYNLLLIARKISDIPLSNTVEEMLENFNKKHLLIFLT